jgi:hypothetical protein
MASAAAGAIMQASFLHVLVQVVSTRFASGVGMVDEDAILRHQLVQALATGPRPFSQVQGFFPPSRRDHPKLSQLVKELARFIPATSSRTQSHYEIHPALLAEFDPYSIYLAPEQRAAALEYVAEMRKKHPAVFRKNPLEEPLPLLTPTFAHLDTLLQSREVRRPICRFSIAGVWLAARPLTRSRGGCCLGCLGFHSARHVACSCCSS